MTRLGMRLVGLAAACVAMAGCGGGSKVDRAVSPDGAYTAEMTTSEGVSKIRILDAKGKAKYESKLSAEAPSAADLIWAGSEQVNLQTPFEIVRAWQLVDGAWSEKHTSAEFH